MSITETLAEDLARDRILAMEPLGNDQLYAKVAKVLGVSSNTLQKAFLTSIRLRLAERRGRLFLETTLRAADTGAPLPAAPRAPDPGH